MITLRREPEVDLSSAIGSVALANPILTAAGTAGHGAELEAYFPLARLGAHVVKSLAATSWPGNPAPRVHPAGASMLNSVGLQGPGVAAWLRDELPALEQTGALIVASIWGRTVDEFARAAELLGAASPCVVAVEVNVSCPNLEARNQMFAHSPEATSAAIAASAACGRPRWAKLSPNTPDLVEIAGAALGSGAEALVLVNTLLGMALDIERHAPVLGGVGGGLSGPALHPVAVRAVFECHAAYPTAPIVGVGGVASATDAVELLLAGASAVEVGTATLADPRASLRILEELSAWCDRHGVERVASLVGAGHKTSSSQSAPLREGAAR